MADDAEGVRRAMATSPGRVLIWLDDTPSPQFLGSEGLTRGEISAWINGASDSGSTIVAHLMWPSDYRAANMPPPTTSQRFGPQTDPWRAARECLTLPAAPPVLVSHEFSRPELERCARIATETGDSRLAAALADGQYGLTQHLAGAPQLVEHWELGRTSHAYGAALITAAIDLTRLGFQVLSPGMLAAAMPAYLTDDQIAEGSGDTFQDALDYAKAPLRGGVRVLRPLPGAQVGVVAGYKVSDYLQQRGELSRHYVPVPTRLWGSLNDHVTDLAVLSRLALTADDRGLGDQALPMLLRTYKVDEECCWRLIYILVRQDREDLLRELASEGIGQAQWGLAWLRIRGDQLEHLASHWGSEAVNGDAWFNLAELLHARGKEAALRQLMDAGYDDGRFFLVRLLAQNDREEDLAELADGGDWDAQMNLAAMLARQGRIEEAIAEYDDIMECAGDDYPDEAGRALASLFARTGRENELKEWMAYDADYRALPMYYADLLAKQGRLDELRQLAEARADDLPIVKELARLLRRLGQVDELREIACRDPGAARSEFLGMLVDLSAEQELRALSRDGKEADVHEHLVALLVAQNREDEIRRMAKGGDRHAQSGLVTLLTMHGKEREIKQMAAAGDPAASRHCLHRLQWTLD